MTTTAQEQSRQAIQFTRDIQTQHEAGHQKPRIRLAAYPAFTVRQLITGAMWAYDAMRRARKATP